MPETDDLLTALRDVGVTTPSNGDAGDAEIQSMLQREIAGLRQAHRRVRIRRRTALRCGVVGAAAAVAAGVVVATGAAGGATTPRLAFPGAHASPAAPVRTQDTAYIVKRVKANVAAGGQNGTVIRYAIYYGGDVSADGSAVNLGWKQQDGYDYAAPDGTEYSRLTAYYKDESTEQNVFDEWAPGASGGEGTDTETDVTPAARLYSQERYEGSDSLVGGQGSTRNPNLFSTPAQVQAGLQSGQVTQQGTVTIDGASAIALSMVAPNAPGNPNTDIALYVDAQTYQPLRMMSYQVGAPDLTVSDWVPTTPTNIAMAKDDSIPAGYTKTTHLRVNAATFDR